MELSSLQKHRAIFMTRMVPFAPCFRLLDFHVGFLRCVRSTNHVLGRCFPPGWQIGEFQEPAGSLRLPLLPLERISTSWPFPMAWQSLYICFPVISAGTSERFEVYTSLRKPLGSRKGPQSPPRRTSPAGKKGASLR